MSETQVGPVDYLVIEFPDGTVSPGGFAALVDRVDAGIVYIVDIEFFRRDDAGLTSVPAHDFGVVDGLDFAEFDGAASGLLDADDVATVTRVLSPGSVGVVIVYEDLTMIPALDAFEAAGARLVAAGPVSPDDLDAALGDD
ncbi:DUF6325 family protein [Gordonia spumicola]|nr:DUF6325 family protein [Gordonia spumicola]